MLGRKISRGTLVARRPRMARILVVDDDPCTVTALTRLLASDGYEVVGFTTGADAVAALSRETFDAIVTDLNMPRVDGRAVVAAAREHFPTACVVVVTAEAGATGDDSRPEVETALKSTTWGTADLLRACGALVEVTWLTATVPEPRAAAARPCSANPPWRPRRTGACPSRLGSRTAPSARVCHPLTLAPKSR